MRIFFGLIISILFFACEGKHPEMQGKKLVLCDSVTMKKNHNNCETIYIEPNDTLYSLVFKPFLNNNIPVDPYDGVFKGQTLNRFYQVFLTKHFGVTAVKGIECFHLTDTHNEKHVYFVFHKNALIQIDYRKDLF